MYHFYHSHFPPQRPFEHAVVTGVFPPPPVFSSTFHV